MKLKASKFDIRGYEDLGMYFSIELRTQENGKELYCIKSGGGLVMDRKGDWQYESMPSERAEAFIKATRFTLKQAKALARKHIPSQMKERREKIKEVMAKKEKKA